MSVAIKAAMASMVLLAVSASGVQAATSGKIEFNGEIMESACAIKPGSEDQIITLPHVAKSQLVNAGVSPTTTFRIELVGCDLGALQDKTIETTFVGSEAGNVPGTLGTSGSAKGVGIGLVDGTGTAVVLGSPTKPQKFQAGDNTLMFGAYLKGRASATPPTPATSVVPGDYAAVASFSLNYK